MKKLWIFISALAFALSAFVGCDKGAETQVTDIVRLASFEGYEEVKKYRQLNEFGEIEPVLGGEFVTDGNYALRVEVHGNYLNANNYPAIGLLTGTGNAVAKTDFEDVEQILLDVYNDNDTAEKVYLQYLTRTEVGMKLSSRNGVTVPAKTKTTVAFEIERDILASLLNLKSVSQVRIVFDNEKEYNQTPRRFYIDNLRAKLTDTPINESVKVREDGEIESADKEDYLAAWQNMNSYNFAPSSLTYNSDPRFIKDGEGSFCMTNVLGFIDATGGDYYGGGWKMITPFNDFNGYTHIEFWVYIDCTEAIQLQTLNAAEDEYIYLGMAKPNEWTQFSVPMELFGTEEELANVTHFYVTARFPNKVISNIYFDEIRVINANE